MFIGDGPELPARAATPPQGLDGVVFTGAVPHEQMPACLAAADIGVAPFDLGAHAPLSLGFYWSPLKIFEYMAAGLPVVAPACRPHLRSSSADEREGLLYDPAIRGARRMRSSALTDPALRQRARARRPRARRPRLQLAAHCEALDRAMRSLSIRDVLPGPPRTRA